MTWCLESGLLGEAAVALWSWLNDIQGEMKNRWDGFSFREDVGPLDTKFTVVNDRRKKDTRHTSLLTPNCVRKTVSYRAFT